MAAKTCQVSVWYLGEAIICSWGRNESKFIQPSLCFLQESLTRSKDEEIRMKDTSFDRHTSSLTSAASGYSASPFSIALLLFSMVKHFSAMLLFSPEAVSLPAQPPSSLLEQFPICDIMRTVKRQHETLGSLQNNNHELLCSWFEADGWSSRKSTVGEPLLRIIIKT